MISLEDEKKKKVDILEIGIDGMPEIDGLQVCEKIKTAGLPVKAHCTMRNRTHGYDFLPALKDHIKD
jgi:CheY-like chemotaxis protein